MSSSPRRRGWELQLHPPGGHGRVRYLQLSVARRNWLVALLSLAVLGVLFGLALFPRLWADWAAVHPEGASGLERAQEMRRLQALLQRVEEVHPRSLKVRYDLQTLHAAYGLVEPARAPATPPPTEPPASVSEAVARGLALLEEAERELLRAEALGQEVRSFQQRDPAAVRGTPSIRPLAADTDGFVLVSGFGERQDAFTERQRFHAGLDLAAPPGTPVVTTADGVVGFAGSFTAGSRDSWWRFGLLAVILHGDRLATVYGHCQDLAVRAGQRVRRGEVIGRVGNSGWSQVPHLHYEVRRRQAARFLPEDPRLFMLEPAWGDPDLLFDAKASPRPQDIEPLPAGLER